MLNLNEALNKIKESERNQVSPCIKETFQGKIIIDWEKLSKTNWNMHDPRNIWLLTELEILSTTLKGNYSILGLGTNTMNPGGVENPHYFTRVEDAIDFARHYHAPVNYEKEIVVGLETIPPTR